MSILSSIFGKIFPSTSQAAQQAAAAGATKSPSAAPNVDVEAILSGMAAKSNQQLNWKESIVDLMKLLGLDSSLTARQTLARELNYTGDVSDSATMNVWLQKEVMKKIAENGGKIPEIFIKH